MSRDAPSIGVQPMERIGKNIAEARHRAGFSQAVLARRCGLHRTEISLIECAGRTPRIDTLLKIAGSLEVPLESLVRGLEWIVSGCPDEAGTLTVFDRSLRGGGEDGEEEQEEEDHQAGD